MQPEFIADAGGIANYSDSEAVEAIKQGRVRSIGANQYMVETDGGVLFDNNGNPFIFSYSLDAATANIAISASRSLKARRELRSL